LEGGEGGGQGGGRDIPPWGFTHVNKKALNNLITNGQHNCPLPPGKKQINVVEPTTIGGYTWGRDFVVKGI